MKLKLNYLLPLMTLAAVMLPQAALADSLTLTLSNAIQSTTAAGGTLSFVGTISAASTNTGFEFLNGDQFSYNGPGSIDDSPLFTDAPSFLTAGQSFTGTIFQVVFSSGAAAGIFPGSFSILGGSTLSDTNTLATAAFQANVTTPAVGVTPEPSSLILLGTGMLGAFTAMKRRVRS